MVADVVMGSYCFLSPGADVVMGSVCFLIPRVGSDGYGFVDIAVDEVVVAGIFKFAGEFLPAGLDDLAVHENVNEIGDDVVQQSLVVGDDDE